MNTAYAIAAIALVMAMLLAWLGAANRSSNNRAEAELGAWFLVAAAVLLVAAGAFAAGGLEIQYYQ